MLSREVKWGWVVYLDEIELEVNICCFVGYDFFFCSFRDRFLSSFSSCDGEEFLRLVDIVGNIVGWKYKCWV